MSAGGPTGEGKPTLVTRLHNAIDWEVGELLQAGLNPATELDKADDYNDITFEERVFRRAGITLSLIDENGHPVGQGSREVRLTSRIIGTYLGEVLRTQKSLDRLRTRHKKLLANGE